MTKSISILLIVIVLIGCHLSNAAKYITEKPDYLKPCERKTPEYSECLAQVFGHLITTWKGGVPGAEGQTSIDPVLIENYNIAENSSNAATFDIKISNMLYSGVGQSKLRHVNATDKDYNFKLYYSSPSTRFEGNYRAVGKILLLQLDANGTMLINVTNCDFIVSMKLQLKERDQMKFFDVKSLKFRVKSIEKVGLRFDNLFADKELNDNANFVFSQNWRDLFSLIQPNVEKRLSDGFSNHFQNIFNVMPAKFFITDVESDG